MIIIAPEELETIRKSYIEISKNSKNLFDNFYAKFFEIDPSVKKFFTNVNMNKQKQMLFESITYFINDIEITDTDLDEYVQTLKLKHQSMKIKLSQMNSFKEAFLDTLSSAHGEAFTDEIRNIWIELLDEIFSRFAKQE